MPECWRAGSSRSRLTGRRLRGALRIELLVLLFDFLRPWHSSPSTTDKPGTSSYSGNSMFNPIRSGS